MQTFALWCTTSSEEYDLTHITLVETARSPFVRKIIVVVTGDTAPPTFGALASPTESQKIYRIRFCD